MITLIIGTNRPDSNSRRVSNHVEEVYAALKVPLRVLDLAKLPPQIFAPESYAMKPPEFQPFSQGILDAEGLIVLTPEYNGGMPGILKYFIDMLKFPESFEHRPWGFICLAAGPSVPLRPFSHFHQIFWSPTTY